MSDSIYIKKYDIWKKNWQNKYSDKLYDKYSAALKAFFKLAGCDPLEKPAVTVATEARLFEID